ncbi:5-oxoprolinase subunit B family protein [Ahniella affigens]|uniref:5-oxoprolinase subunit B family protein n=1 Tax=Ahniella affigens TaxID=2021234 RepID=UPI0014766D02|nr:carboxyltransferase domain-containing protein [Ahniella affigens]
MRKLRVIAITERHFRLSLPAAIDLDTQRTIHALDHFLRAQDWPDRIAQWPGYADLVIEVRAGGATDALAERLESGLQHWLDLEAVDALQSSPDTQEIVWIDVDCSPANAVDLAHCAACCGLTEAAYLERFFETTFTVGLIGFQPGFPYLLGLPESLHVPRRESPRARVPAGSVAIAGAQAGIYPERSPGGWNLIGQTNVRLFDPERTPCSLLRPGMQIQFRNITGRKP